MTPLILFFFFLVTKLPSEHKLRAAKQKQEIEILQVVRQPTNPNNRTKIKSNMDGKIWIWLQWLRPNMVRQAFPRAVPHGFGCNETQWKVHCGLGKQTQWIVYYCEGNNNSDEVVAKEELLRTLTDPLKGDHWPQRKNRETTQNERQLHDIT